MACIFCELKQKGCLLFETKSFFGVWDINPVQDGHLLIISKNHVMNINEFDKETLHEMIELQSKLVSAIEANTPVLGTTTLYNNGNVMMDKTHFHFHIVPRYKNDGFYDNQSIRNHTINKKLIEDLIK